jgi:purine-binding chemotaxis protein CheW
MDETRHYLSFRVGQLWYGVDVTNVIEVLHMLALTEVPAAETRILGLMTLRDKVMPVIDLRRHFGLPEPQFHLNTPVIAVHIAQSMAGLVVDEVDNVERVTADQLTAYDGPRIAQVSGVARTPERLLLLIDTEAINTQA